MFSRLRHSDSRVLEGRADMHMSSIERVISCFIVLQGEEHSQLLVFLYFALVVLLLPLELPLEVDSGAC